MNTILPNLKYSSMAFSLNQPVTDNIEEELKRLGDDFSEVVEYSFLSSVYSSSKGENADRWHWALSAISIASFFAVISISIINNILITEIRKSKRQIGTLRAFGASSKEIFISYIKQLISMLKWGILLGFIASIALCVDKYLYYLKYINEWNSYLEKCNFFPWGAVVIMVAIFVVCALAIFLEIKKQSKNSIIENIREL
ncbi:MAG: ABC transporter permease [Clostridiales bacterium]|nr:ABC transporter permease [Clostridiales bacterium]